MAMTKSTDPLVLGIAIKGQLWYLIGISTYYTEENIGTIRFYELVERLLSGAILPLFLFPEWLARLSAFLPFVYTLYEPVNALLRPPSWAELAQALAGGVIWCALLALLSRLVAANG